MSLELSWGDIAIRLFLTVLGGALIGLNREERGHAAGLRTVLLVSLAAAISMIQVNLLLGVVGKASNSFIVMDLMRLPLGILSGMGFIGAGAILRKGNLVRGVTTAATLWFVTVMGLCFGGGQLGLGSCALGLGLIVLIVVRKIENHFKEDLNVTLTMIAGRNAPSEEEIVQAVHAAGFQVTASSVTIGENAALQEITCELKWRAPRNGPLPSQLLRELSARFGLAKIDWRVAG